MPETIHNTAFIHGCFIFLDNLIDINFQTVLSLEQFKQIREFCSFLIFSFINDWDKITFRAYRVGCYNTILLDNIRKRRQFIHCKNKIEKFQEFYFVSGQNTSRNKGNEVPLVFHPVPVTDP